MMQAKGIVLKIADGRIKEITAGNSKDVLSVRCEDCLITGKESRTINFFRPIHSLRSGIPIRAMSEKRFSRPRTGLIPAVRASAGAVRQVGI